MEGEQTLGDVFDNLFERLADVRTRAIMGERAAALEIMIPAHRDFQEFREILSGLPGYYALEYDYNATLAALCGEESRADGDWLTLDRGDEMLATTQSPLETLWTRKRSRRTEQKAA